jgi:hypothetical protein
MMMMMMMMMVMMLWLNVRGSQTHSDLPRSVQGFGVSAAIWAEAVGPASHISMCYLGRYDRERGYSEWRPL